MFFKLIQYPEGHSTLKEALVEQPQSETSDFVPQAEPGESPEQTALKANGKDIAFVLVEVFDKDWNPCPLAKNLVKFDIKGPAVIAATGNGNPQSLEPFIADHRELFYGKAMLIIQSSETTGTIKLKASSKGLKAAQIEIDCIQ